MVRLPIAVFGAVAASAVALPMLFAASSDQKPAVKVPDCSGYPEPRVYLETQSWWSDARVGFPGQHIHLGTCFPLLQPVSGVLTLDVHGILHHDPGNVDFLRMQVWERGNQITHITQPIPGGWSCPGVSECVRDFQISIDTDTLDQGRREFRLTFNIPTTPIGNRQFNTTRWHACIRSCTSAGEPPVDDAPEIDRMGAAGWYTSSEYTNVRINAADGQRLAYQPVSGIVAIQVLGEDDLLEVAVDAKAHGMDPGLVLYDGPGLGQWRTVLIDTSLLANGTHKLFLRGDEPDLAPAGINSGVFVLPFRVDNVHGNVAPVCSPLGVAVIEDRPAIGLAPSCTDANLDPLTFAIDAEAARGTASVTGAGNLRYEPTPGETGADSFSYIASDGATTSAPATVNVMITPNAIPECAPLGVSVVEGRLDVELAPWCSDANLGEGLTYAIESPPARGTAMVTSAGNLRYEPVPGETGADSFTYTASDAMTTSQPATVSVMITPNAMPSCAPLDLTVVQDGAGEGVAPLCSDANLGEALTYAIESQGTLGTALVTGAGILRYIPDPSQSGTDSFTYTASDFTTTSPPATVNVTITAANAVPACSPRSLTATQDGPAVDVAPSCTDANGDSLGYSIASQGTKGIASIFGGQLRYTPNAGQFGADSFTYTAGDGTATSAPAAVSVIITPTASTPLIFTPVADTFVNSASPTANNGSATTLSARGTSPQVNSYLRFTVSGVGSASRAVLRLYVSDPSPDAGKLHRVALNTWPENLRHSARPALGALITDLGAVSSGAYREIDVSAYVTGDGTYSFAVVGENLDLARFHSREGVNDPQLVVTP